MKLSGEMRAVLNSIKEFIKKNAQVVVGASKNIVPLEAREATIKNIDLFLDEATSEQVISAKVLSWIAEKGKTLSITDQTLLGICYASGIGVAKDLKLAAECFRQAAEQGFAVAQFNLGAFYEFDIGEVGKDPKLAAECYRQAAEQGFAVAKASLAWCYAKGFGVIKDAKLAADFVQQAAEQGHACTQAKLGEIYLQSDGVLKDEKYGAELSQLAADKEDVTGQFNLGRCYEGGIGVRKNLKRATLLYQALARQGHRLAKARIQSGDLQLLEANLGPPKLEEAMGDNLGTLAFCYLMGLGVRKDLDKGLMYLKEAISNGCSAALWDVVVLCRNSQLEFDREPLYKLLKSDSLPLSIETERRACLAYLYKKGAPGFPQDLARAQAYSQSVSPQLMLPPMSVAAGARSAAPRLPLRRGVSPARRQSSPQTSSLSNTFLSLSSLSSLALRSSSIAVGVQGSVQNQASSNQSPAFTGLNFLFEAAKSIAGFPIEVGDASISPSSSSISGSRIEGKPEDSALPSEPPAKKAKKTRNARRP